MTKETPTKIWSDFKTAFTKTLDSAGIEKFKEAWQSLEKKTSFYETTFMPTMERNLGLKLWVERMRCDYMLVNSDNVPLSQSNVRIRTQRLRRRLRVYADWLRQ
jgi:hypothetical protein